MPLLRTLTTRRLFTLVNVATTGAALLLASIASVTYDVFTIHDRCVRSLTAEAEMIGYNAASALVFNDRAAAAATLKGLRAETQLLAAGIFRADGVVFVTYVRDDPSVAAALVTASEGDGHRLIGDRLLVFRAINIDGEKIGSIRLLSAMEEVTASLLRHLVIASVIFIAAIGASLPVLARLHKRISGPIMDLVSKVHSVSVQKDYRVTTSGQDEIVLLVRTFSEMLSQIQERDQELAKARYVPETAAPGVELDQARTASAEEVIERNVRSQAQLIKDLLDVIESLQATAALKGVRLQLVVDPRAIVITVDPERLQRILWNLLSNAIKFTPAGGRVRVVAHRIDSHVEISVSDTGRGIDPGFLRHVFDRVHQADSTTTRADGGLGGLSIVRRLVELDGGRVRVESAGEGQGTTFTVELPITIVHAPAASERVP